MYLTNNVFGERSWGSEWLSHFPEVTWWSVRAKSSLSFASGSWAYPSDLALSCSLMRCALLSGYSCESRENLGILLQIWLVTSVLPAVITGVYEDVLSRSPICLANSYSCLRSRRNCLLLELLPDSHTTKLPLCLLQRL